MTKINEPNEFMPLIGNTTPLSGPTYVHHSRPDNSASYHDSPTAIAADDPVTSANDHDEPSNEILKSVSGNDLCLLNTGSVARDHLASERTYLAYVRTSLALSSAGVALMQFLRLGQRTKQFAEPLGSMAIVFGILVLFVGTRRFFLVQRTLVNGYFPASSLEMISISFILGSLITATFGVIIVGRNG